jgi:thiol-disulfide isomerase/thioredoxin
MTQQAIGIEQLLDELGDALRRYRARRRRRSLRILVVAAVGAAAATALGATYGVLWDVPAPFRALKTPLAVPPISGRDILSGRRVDSGDIAGRRGFLIVWQSDCRPCLPELAAVQAFAAANPKIPVVGLDVNDLPASARKVLKQMHITFPSVAADFSILDQRLGIKGFPTVLAFDAHGKVIAIAAGMSQILAKALTDITVPTGGGG